MKGSNYYLIQDKRYKKNSPSSLKELLNWNNRVNFHKKLQSLEKDRNKKIYYNYYTEINNISPSNDYSINDDTTNRKYRNDYSNINNSREFNKKIYEDENSFMTYKRNLFFNSISTSNLGDSYYKKEKQSRLSDYIIKPYKKKTIIMNPIKKNNKARKINVNLTTTPHTNIINKSHTDRTLYKTTVKTDITNNNININLKKKFANNKNNNSNNIFRKIDNKKKSDESLMSIFYNNDNYYNKGNLYTNNNYYYNYRQGIHLSKGKSKKRTLGKLTKRNNVSKHHSITPNKDIYEKYKKRFSQVLLILLEKYYKTYLLRFKYLFINNLKNYLAHKKNLRKRNRNIRNLFQISPNNEDSKEANNNYYQEDRKNNFYSTYNNFIKDKLLMNRIKDRNACNSQDRLNQSELCRNKTELIKMKEIIKRRKKTQTRSKSEGGKDKESISQNKNREIKEFIKVKKIVFRKKKSNSKSNSKKLNKSSINFYKKNKKKENLQKNRNNPQFIDNKGRILIVKKICTDDNKINIDIKYIDYMNFKKKKKFKNLKISKDFSIDLIRQSSNKQIIIRKLGKVGYKYYNNKDMEYEYNNKSSLGLIKEEEEKSMTDDKYQSKYSSEDKYNNYV